MSRRSTRSACTYAGRSLSLIDQARRARVTRRSTKGRNALAFAVVVTTRPWWVRVVGRLRAIAKRCLGTALSFLRGARWRMGWAPGGASPGVPRGFPLGGENALGAGPQDGGDVHPELQ